MFGKSHRWLVPLAGILAVLFIAPSAGAAVSRPPEVQNFSFNLDAKKKQGCSFDVTVTGTGGKITQIVLRDGRIFFAGKGVLLTYTNDTNGNTYSVNTSGSVAKYEVNPDGTVTATYTGHNGFVYFGNDAPGAGITQYTGTLVLTLESFDTFKVLSVDATSGTAVDVCEAIK
ncbi:MULTISPECIES: hypothetical protein [unclassified Arthrobacter]|uniref:hypothetical protein n=1 Tax=unclassified Arthrobacter TaxID=235627 RepID=UPI00131A2B91|nr:MULTISPECIES: hypothetical protein [unclassified Arthrobacter]MDT0196984.1 hypothetical protein [Arthrobacter sp. AB6]